MQNYWKNKEVLSSKAKERTQLMRSLYSGAIDSSVKNTRVYSGSVNYDKCPPKFTEIVVDETDTVSAGYKHRQGVTALLNFASYKEPGGMFLAGSCAQEECLCHASYLYNVLMRFRDTFYAWNNEHKNSGLYLNRALYSPAVVFEIDNDTYLCDVITCAAPNKTAAKKYCDISDEENTKYLKARIKFVLDIAKTNSVETLILGAYGCGVFGQDPSEVSNIFKDCLSSTHKDCFSKVVFAIPGGENLVAFKETFSA